MASPVPPPSSPPWTTARGRDTTSSPPLPSQRWDNTRQRSMGAASTATYAVSDSRMDYGNGPNGFGGSGYPQQQQQQQQQDQQQQQQQQAPLPPLPPPVPSYGLWTGPSFVPTSSAGSGSSRNSISGGSGTGEVNGGSLNLSYGQNGYDSSLHHGGSGSGGRSGSQPPYYHQNMNTQPLSIPSHQSTYTINTTNTTTNGGQYTESPISPLHVLPFGYTTQSPAQHPNILSNKRKSMTETFVPSHAGPPSSGPPGRRQGSGGGISSSPLSSSLPIVGGGSGGGSSGPRESSLEAANALAGLGQSHPMRASLSTPTPGKSGDIGATGSKRMTPLAASQPPKKKKKKKRKDGDDEEDGRRKTSRACDVCRTKKIRCDIIIQPVTEDPSARATSSDPHPHGLCAHCKNASLECTFFMPITETRFKRRKQEEAAETNRVDISTTHTASPIETVEKREGHHNSRKASPWEPNVDQKVSTYGETQSCSARVEGPTSISFLLHSTSAVPRNIVDSYDLKYHTTWAVTSQHGSGIIRVSNPPAFASFADQSTSSHSNHDENGEEHRLESSAKRPDGKNLLTSKMISSLVNDYFEHIAPLFPIVSKSDFANSESPSPLLLYVMCGVAATRRGKPKDVFSAIRGVINGMIRNNDVLSDSSYENVQALLILSLVGDLNAQPVAKTVSACVNRISAAIRMAQDLGMHREGGQKIETAAQLARIELKRRVWACCVILDRWYAMCLGIPQIIDIYDCDVLVPCPCDVVPGKVATEWTLSPTMDFGHISEHLKLTILIGRILKTIYSPTGLMHTSDEQLTNLNMDMNEWRANLPQELRFTGNGSSHAAGLLHCTWVAANFLFCRVFMRLSYSVPAHLKFSMTMEKWNELIAWSRETIVWLHHNETALDTLFMWAYTSTSCALIQYHTWIRRRDKTCLDTLKMLKETVERWELATQPDNMSIRKKSIEVMTLLYAAALRAHTDDPDSSDFPDTTVLNPTSGVSRQVPKGLAKLVFRKDPTRMGGGIFVADPSHGNIDATGLPAGLVVVESNTPAGGRSAPQSQQQQGDVAASTSQSYNPTSARNGSQNHREYQLVPSAAVSALVGDNQDRQNQPLPGNMNVNPGINQIAENWAENGIDCMLNTNSFTPSFGQFSDSNYAFVGDDGHFGLDVLEGMPQNGFDWPEWQQYFSRLGVPNGDEMGQMGDMHAGQNGWQNYGAN